jgi:hypothetical protein
MSRQQTIRQLDKKPAAMMLSLPNFKLIEF